jgi:subtilisin family serine protease
MSGPNSKTSLNYSLIFNPTIKRSVLTATPELGFKGGQGVRVAVIDSGVNPEVKVFDDTDFTGFGSSDGIPNKHGTIVANIIKHFAKNTDILNIKVTQTESNINWSYVMKGLAYARDNGAHIVNLSLGHYSGTQCLGKCQKCREVQAFAQNTGMIIVVAVGNNGPKDETANCPAMAPDIIAVGMTNYPGDGVEDISSRSTPGISKPNLLTSGYVNLNSTTPIRGTSFAAPVITGILSAALPIFKFNSTHLVNTLYNACEKISSVPGHHQGHGVLNLKLFMEAIKHETATTDSQRQS